MHSVGVAGGHTTPSVPRPSLPRPLPSKALPLLPFTLMSCDRRRHTKRESLDCGRRSERLAWGRRTWREHTATWNTEQLAMNTAGWGHQLAGAASAGQLACLVTGQDATRSEGRGGLGR